MAGKKKKNNNPVTSIEDAAKKYKTYNPGGSTDPRAGAKEFTEWKNYGLDNMMQAIKSRLASGGGRQKIGVYINAKQAKKFSDVVAYAKSLNIDVGIAKAGSKKRPYDLFLGSDPVAVAEFAKKFKPNQGADAAAGTEDFSSEIARKIMGGITTSKKRFQG